MISIQINSPNKDYSTDLATEGVISEKENEAKPPPKNHIGLLNVICNYKARVVFATYCDSNSGAIQQNPYNYYYCFILKVTKKLDRNGYKLWNNV